MSARARVNTALKAEHVYICGGTGTGKSSTIKKAIAKAGRVIVFDPDDEYSDIAGFVRVTSARELINILRAGKKRLKIAFVCEGQKAFALWCDAVFLWANCIAVAEEIADVTSPQKAPPAWGRLIRRGRKYGIKLFAVTQKPPEADKTILSNAAYIRTYQLGRDADRVAIAREMNIDVKLITALKPLEYIEYERASLGVKSGKLGVKKEIIIR